MLCELNPEQRTAVVTDRHLAVLAIPGSGKTRVIVERSVRLLEKSTENRVLAITFTNKAGQELKARITSASSSGAKRIAIGTFHSVALRQLKRAGQPTKIVSNALRNILVGRAHSQISPNWGIDESFQVIDRFKLNLQEKWEPSTEYQLYSCYQSLLTRQGYIDFSDILASAIRGMNDGTVAPIGCTHLLVDEYQDVDDIQISWISEHAKNGAILTVVGDDDQSIYSFRSAKGYSGLKQFITQYSAERIILTRNYRSRSEILDAAGQLISHNVGRFDKSLIAEKGSGGNIDAYEFGTIDDEVAAITDTVKFQADRWAVLARTNRILNALEARLIEYRVPYERIGGDSLWDNKRPALLIFILTWLNEGLKGGLENILHAIRIQEEDIDEILAWLEGSSAVRLLDRGSQNRCPMTTDTKGKIEPLLDTMFLWVDILADRASSESINRLIISVTEFILDYCHPKVRVSEVGASDVEYASKVLRNFKGDLTSRLLAISIPVRREESSTSGVTLITMHASKGLEYPNVWIMGCAHGLVPHSKATGSGETTGLSALEEERRLFYVAMTRAQEKLHLSYSKDEKYTVSQFISEARLGIKEVEKIATQSL